MLAKILTKLFGHDTYGWFRWNRPSFVTPDHTRISMQRAKAKRERKNARRLQTWTGRR